MKTFRDEFFNLKTGINSKSFQSLEWDFHEDVMLGSWSRTFGNSKNEKD